MGMARWWWWVVEFDVVGVVAFLGLGKRCLRSCSTCTYSPPSRPPRPLSHTVLTYLAVALFPRPEQRQERERLSIRAVVDVEGGRRHQKVPQRPPRPRVLCVADRGQLPRNPPRQDQIRTLQQRKRTKWIHVYLHVVSCEISAWLHILTLCPFPPPRILTPPPLRRSAASPIPSSGTVSWTKTSAQRRGENWETSSPGWPPRASCVSSSKALVTTTPAFPRAIARAWRMRMRSGRCESSARPPP